MKHNRVLLMLLADVMLVVAQIIFFSASATNDTMMGLPMFGLSILLVGVIAWAAITASGFWWLRILNGTLLTIFVVAWVVITIMFFLHDD